MSDAGHNEKNGGKHGEKHTRAFRKIIHLAFPPESSGSPVVCQLVRQFDITFNVLKAQITPRKEGYLTLTIEGGEENWKRALAYLKERGIKVSTAAGRIFRDEESCMHCGLCTGICPPAALTNDPNTYKVLFDKEKCTACGLCTKICPVHAMRVELEGDGEEIGIF